MARLVDQFYANVCIAEVCVCCPRCEMSHYIEADSDDAGFYFAEKNYNKITCTGCDAEITVLAIQIIDTEYISPS